MLCLAPIATLFIQKMLSSSRLKVGSSRKCGTVGESLSDTRTPTRILVVKIKKDRFLAVQEREFEPTPNSNPKLCGMNRSRRPQ